MSYDNNVPQAGQLVSVTQQPILNNFSFLQTYLQTDHRAFASGTSGFHNKVTFPVGAAAASAAGQNVLYAKADGSGRSQIFARRDGVADEYQLTRLGFGSFTRFGTNTAYAANHTGGWTFLPGGLILQYGIRSSAGTPGTITFPISFTNAASIFMIQLTFSRPNSSSTQSVSINSAVPFTATSFAFNTSSTGNVNIHWQAIGI